MLPIAQYSRDCLRALRGETGIAYDERSRGTLQLFRTQRQFDDMAKDVAILGDLGVRFETLDTSGCIGAEPGLARSRADIAGGLRLPDDETGDCHAFTTRLASLAADLGVRFSFGVEIQRIVRDGSSVNSVITSQDARMPMPMSSRLAATHPRSSNLWASGSRCTPSRFTR
jgi:D-amino-acid dehydrogenase